MRINFMTDLFSHFTYVLSADKSWELIYKGYISDTL